MVSLEKILREIATDICKNKCDSCCPCRKGCEVSSDEECINRIMNYFKSIAQIPEPNVDVVEVVKCKDCQYSKFIKAYSKYMCDKRNEGRGELKYSNDFCSYGKAK